MMRTLLIAVIVFLSSCDRITPEEKQRLTTEIHHLDKQVAPLRETVSNLEEKKDSLTEDIAFLESKKKVYESGKTPVYMLTLHFQEHKMEISLDRISFSFDVPVDEQFYKECVIGQQLGYGSRSFKLFHGGDITIENKKITYR
jgi:hypothetical protein